MYNHYHRAPIEDRRTRDYSLKSFLKRKMARRSRRSGAYFVTIAVVNLLVAFYTSLQISTLDDSNSTINPVEVELKSLQDEPQNAQENTATANNNEIIPKSVESSCSSIDHGDVRPMDVNVSSIFNCGSKSGSCHWYFPAKFLDASCGIGKEFQLELNHMKNLYESKSLWIGGPPIILPSVRIEPQHMRANQFKEGPWSKHNLSMVHVHKTGGTSLVYAFDALLKKGAKGLRRTVYMPARKETGTSNIYGQRFEESSAFLDGAVKYRKPEDWGEKDHTIFAVVRDPTERFISAIGQATGGRGSTDMGLARVLLNECLKETSKQTLNCFIDMMYTKSTWIEVHFTPMVLEISFATIYKDIPVAIFPFTEVPNLMVELASNPKSKKKDGHKKGNRQSPVLVNMSSDDYDDEMLRKLCAIYKMDVVFMNHLGLTTKCDKFVL